MWQYTYNVTPSYTVIPAHSGHRQDNPIGAQLSTLIWKYNDDIVRVLVF